MTLKIKSAVFEPEDDMYWAVMVGRNILRAKGGTGYLIAKTEADAMALAVAKYGDKFPKSTKIRFVKIYTSISAETGKPMLTATLDTKRK